MDLVKNNFILGKINFDNIFSKILYNTHIPLLIFMIGLTVFLFYNYLRHHKSNINRFHTNTHQVMLIVLIISWTQIFLMSLSIQPRVGILTDLLYFVITLFTIYKLYRGYAKYSDSIYDESTKQDTNQLENSISKLALVAPFLILVKQIIQAFSSDTVTVEYVRGFICAIFLFAIPYLLCIFGDEVSKNILASHLKYYYFRKYPEAFRKQIGLSKETFYGLSYRE